MKKIDVRKPGVPAVIKISAVILTVLYLQPTDIRAENVAAIIKPFQNSADSVSIDELTVENGEDQIAVYGSLNITRDKEGLRRAQQLKALLDETVRRLSSEKLPEHIAIKPVEKTANPFR